MSSEIGERVDHSTKPALQKGADNYTPVVKVANETDLQRSVWVPQFNHLYLSVTKGGNCDAEKLVYEPQS